VKIIVKYDPYGRMGNRLFQYAFGLILSKLKNAEFYHDDIPNFKVNSKPCNFYSANVFTTKSFGNQNVDLDYLINYDGDIIVNSFVQKAKYYIPHRQLLVNELLPNNYMTGSDSLVIHIRETDYIAINGFLGYDYYKKLINDSGFTNITIVTDNSKCDTVQRLVSEGCKLNSEGYVSKFEHTSDTRAMCDFDLLVQSKNIAISQSSFSWWAAFLGNHDKVIFPYKKEGGMWPCVPGIDDVDLFFESPANIKYIQ